MAGERNQHPSHFGGHCNHCGGTVSKADDGALRCACGSLLARYVDRGIELKCRRCKRTVIVIAAIDREEIAG